VVARPADEAWQWDGAAAHPVPIPAGFAAWTRLTRQPADLRGDGQPLWASLSPGGQLEVRDGSGVTALLVWHNEHPAWRVTRIDVGDPDDDGRIEVLLLLWRPDADGLLRAHPFLMGWRGGRFRVVWGGSATPVPIQDLATGDLDGDGRNELVVLEGGSRPGDAADTLSIWQWHGWGFELAWRSPRAQRLGLVLQDVTGDGLPEALARRR
jgi:hypothetical protein